MFEFAENSEELIPVVKVKNVDALVSYRMLTAGWFALCLVSYVHYRLLTGIQENLFFGLLNFATCYYLWLLLAPLAFRLERRFPILRPFSRRNAFLLLLLGIPICWGASLGALNTVPLLHRVLPHVTRVAEFSLRIPSNEAELQASLFLIALGISNFLRYVAEVRQKELKTAQLAVEKAQLQGALREAELETLRIRLNPHFLFNCLQNVSSLAEENPRAASTMLARLGDLLRVALSDDYQAQISLRQEIALTRAYLSIEQIRFGDRLSVLFCLDPLAERSQVPSLLLQPLVENALKHGLSRNGQGLISIGSSVEAGMLILTIRDSGIGLAENKGETVGFGVGLAATRERLERIYGENQSVLLQSLAEGGTEVRLSLPAIYTPDANTARFNRALTTQTIEQPKLSA